MDNENIYLIDNNLNYSRYSAEGLHSLNLNRWNGWLCSAGLRSLYIDFDGNVWRATCSEGGWIGNINSMTGLVRGDTLTDGIWVECKKEVCACGADMAVPKVKDKKFIPIFFKIDGKKAQGLSIKEHLDKNTTTIDPSIVYSDANEMFKTVIWDIGRLCNFDCHYCSKNSHNNFDPVKNLKFMTNAYENIQNNWNVNKEKIKFVITGGEPTVYRDYLPFVKMVKEEGHIVHTTTNGSNSEEYYKELAKYSDIAFSIHLNYVKHFGIEKFTKSVKAAATTTDQGYIDESESKYNWVIVRIMLDPGNLEIAKEVYNSFKENFSIHKNFVLAVDLVHDTSSGKELYNYSKEELDWISSIHS